MVVYSVSKQTVACVTCVTVNENEYNRDFGADTVAVWRYRRWRCHGNISKPRLVRGVRRWHVQRRIVQFTALSLTVSRYVIGRDDSSSNSSISAGPDGAQSRQQPFFVGLFRRTRRRHWRRRQRGWTTDRWTTITCAHGSTQRLAGRSVPVIFWKLKLILKLKGFEKQTKSESCCDHFSTSF